jgi:hypothetical protein
LDKIIKLIALINNVDNREIAYPAITSVILFSVSLATLAMRNNTS